MTLLLAAATAAAAAGELADGRFTKRKRLEKKTFFLGIQKGR